jgi:uncharacterized membrane protein
MQMRSAEEARASAMEQNQPPATPHDAKHQPPQPSDETASSDARALAEQETEVFTAPDDPFATSGVTVQSNRSPGAAVRGQEARAPEYVAPPVPSRALSDPEAVTSLTFTPNIAAGMSYLGLWITGVLFFFNERRNRYVRFHALQSILFGALATVAGTATRWHVFFVLGVGIAVLTAFAIVVLWSALVVSAWTGSGLTLPILGRYAKQYAAPEDRPIPTSRP